jgi:O-antigen ligase
MDRERLDRWLELGILGVVALALVFGPVALGGVRPQEFVVLQGLVALGLVLWGARLWVARSFHLQWTPACWFGLAFLVYALVRYWQAEVEYVARLEVIRVLVYGWFFFLVLNNLHRQENLQILAAVTLTVGTLLALYALYQFVSGSNQVLAFDRPEAYKGRGSGTFICPNHLAGHLEMLLPVALAILVLSRRRVLARIFSAYALVMMFIGLCVTVSRGGYIAGGVALLFMAGVLLRYRGYRKPILIGLAVLAILGGAIAYKAEDIQRRVRLALVPGQLHSIWTRPDLWKPAFHMWQDAPWLGVGPAHFDLRFPKYRPETVQTRPLWVHNDYLNLLADWGLVGFGLLAGAAAALAWGGWRTWRYVRREGDGLVTKPSDRAALVLGSGTGLVALALHSVVDFNLQIPANALLAAFLAAVLNGHLRYTSNRYWLNPGLAGRVMMTFLFLATAAWFGQQARQRWQESRWLVRAERATSLADHLAALETAARLEPRNAETPARLGETWRLQSWEGGPNWQTAAQTALRWFEQAMRLNPYDTFPVMRAAMTLDWLGRHEEAERLFDRVVAMDPNNHYVVLLRGWHELQVGRWAEAIRWFERSLAIKPYANWLAHNYLAVAKQRLAEQTARPAPSPRP